MNLGIEFEKKMNVVMMFFNIWNMKWIIVKMYKGKWWEI